MDNMTATEIVSSLAHTSIPTIVVEGRDDMSILRLLEDKSGISVLPCGGKDCLLEVFERREQFSGLKCAFLLDRDTWIFSSVPERYREIVFTTGYSIENDVFYKSKLSKLFDNSSKAFVSEVKPLLISWWAGELDRYFDGRETRFDESIYSIIEGLGEKTSLKLRKQPQVCNQERYKHLISTITSDFELYMRGHQLLDMNRCALKRHSDKDINQLAVGSFKLAAVLGDSPLLNELIGRLNERLEIEE